MVRFMFVVLIYGKVLNKTSKDGELKEAYWLTLTTKEELYSSQGSLNYPFPHIDSSPLIDDL